MTSVTPDSVNRVHFMEGREMNTVTSKDGTKIAYDKTGHGPAVIHVAGAMGTRSFGFPDHARLLESHFTVYTYDRRGRGESTDTRAFAVEREVEDLEALIHEAGGSSRTSCGTTASRWPPVRRSPTSCAFSMSALMRSTWTMN